MHCAQYVVIEQTTPVVVPGAQVGGDPVSPCPLSDWASPSTFAAASSGVAPASTKSAEGDDEQPAARQAQATNRVAVLAGSMNRHMCHQARARVGPCFRASIPGTARHAVC